GSLGNMFSGCADDKQRVNSNYCPDCNENNEQFRCNQGICYAIIYQQRYATERKLHEEKKYF
ncbi:MAG TPA: hypothetical protein DCZ40_06185, partial [Lachnospiraceae bacterium]|nr:hypothetical protein [Lachnospiraceae bacterium]